LQDFSAGAGGLLRAAPAFGPPRRGAAFSRGACAAPPPGRAVRRPSAPSV